MSYQPPPNKSTYGDTELSDDGWSQHSGPPKFTNYPQGNMSGQPMQPAFNQGPGGRYAPDNIQQLGPRQPPAVPDLTALASSMTQDDILFMRRVRRDCFVYRIIPATMTGCGLLYMYNKSKQLPNKFSRFFAVGLGSLFLSISTFRGEFRRMITESRLNTPYMQALRKSIGLDAIVPGGDFSGDSSIDYGSRIADGSTNWDSTELSSDLRYDGKQDSPPLGQFYNDPGYQSLDAGNQETPKPAATYEELRARNRGYNK